MHFLMSVLNVSSAEDLIYVTLMLVWILIEDSELLLLKIFQEF